ncbi:DNA-nicking Smr family endonuclease [Hoeflea marina]|uniref:DNA-nicking Smr family endonuclease n=1 Tax=Hoeflea marina TaxID=274592 RepID=A0A317PKI1_9HYPH|nr:Smr/MutS family protein [Hoeflea marina]PWW00540.1 DNA-nicking Smr family endonuclease [Hoeflea marina]
MADRDRKLTHEDRIVWETVARTVRRLSGQAHPVVVENDTMDGLMSPAADAAAPADVKRPVADPAHPPRTVKPQPRLHPIERPVQKKLARGRLAIDGKIDLHGLNQSEAHNLLFDFLMRAHQRGSRHVLVVTGKGSSMGSEGVLKRAVPQWLVKPEFRFLVSGHEPAARGHGGDGAMYIRLRRQRDDPA